jgi:hypothetical protein
MLKKAVKKTKKSKAMMAVDITPQNSEERYEKIAREAYLLAENRGFQGDMAMDDWLQAEAKVDAQYATSH